MPDGIDFLEVDFASLNIFYFCRGALFKGIRFASRGQLVVRSQVSG
jgi:hypothetical protein